MANYYLNGVCMSEASLLSRDSPEFAPVLIDADSALMFSRHSSVTPLAGTTDQLNSVYVVRNLVSSAVESTVFNAVTVEECSVLGPIDDENFQPAWLEANGLGLVSAVLVLFWLGRIAGKQR